MIPLGGDSNWKDVLVMLLFAFSPVILLVVAAFLFGKV
jgi:hypothetical protein